MSAGDGTWEYYQATIRLMRKISDRAFDLGGTLHIGSSHAHAKRRSRRCFECIPHRDLRRLIEVQNDRHATNLGRNLPEQLQHFAAQRELTLGESSDIGLRPRQTRYKTTADWIVDYREDDRDSACLP